MGGYINIPDVINPRKIFPYRLILGLDKHVIHHHDWFSPDSIVSNRWHFDYSLLEFWFLKKPSFDVLQDDVNVLEDNGLLLKSQFLQFLFERILLGNKKPVKSFLQQNRFLVFDFLLKLLGDKAKPANHTLEHVLISLNLLFIFFFLLLFVGFKRYQFLTDLFPIL
jgi:hypothetical protein